MFEVAFLRAKLADALYAIHEVEVRAEREKAELHQEVEALCVRMSAMASDPLTADLLATIDANNKRIAELEKRDAASRAEIAKLEEKLMLYSGKPANSRRAQDL
jgi:cell division protein FtsB